MLLVLMLVTGYVFTSQYVKTVTQNVVDKLLVQARSYSRPAGKLIISTREPDVLLLNNICRKLTDDNPDVYWVGIVNTENLFLAHTDFRQVVAAAQLEPVITNPSDQSLRAGEELALRNDTIFIVVPIMDHDILLAKLAVASSVGQITAARRKSIVSVVTITVLIILVGLPIIMIVLHRKLRPISVITDSLKQVSFQDIVIDIPVADKNEFGYLAATLNVMGARINAAQRELVEKERIARELEIAREIQANILPRGYPKTSNFEFSGTYRSAKEVGGDYYDFIDIDEDHLGFLVADVSGKSLPGMLVMLLTRDIVMRLAPSIRQPADILTEVNRELLLSIKKGMFVTMFFGVLSKKTGHFMFASAGHNPLIKINGQTGDSELIKTKGYPLGMMPQGPFRARIETGEIQLSEGDWLIQYTDGINEAQNPIGEEFGMDRLVEVVKTHSLLSPKDLAAETLSRLDFFVDSASQYDDITLLAMKWVGPTVDTASSSRAEAISAD